MGKIPQPGLARRLGVKKKSKKSFMPTAKKNSVGTRIVPKKNKKKSEKKVDRTEKSLILSLMNLINLLPSNAAADYASLTDADRADLHAWFDTVNAINDEVEAAWDRFARDVDAGVR